jgi:hypothetical protein
MNKIPVGQTIRQAYAFTFGEIGTVIGLTWIPTLISTVAIYFLLRTYATWIESLESGTPPADVQALLPLPLIVLILFLTGMIGVALTRQVLGLRQGPAIAHVALGREELRVFAGFVGVYLLATLFTFVFLLAVSGVAALAASNPAMGPLAGAITGLAGLIGIFLVVFAIVRLGYLLIPAVVVDGQFGLTRSWQLTNGNFWRIVAVLLATTLPPILVSNIAATIIIGPMPPPPAAAPADLAAAAHLWAGQVRALLPHLPALMGINLVLSPLSSSLLFTAAAFAYRVLSGKAIVKAQDA